MPGLEADIVEGHGEVSGGSLPAAKLRGPVVALTHPALTAQEMERRSREAETPVFGIVRVNAFRLDPRTLNESEIGMAAAALSKVLAGL